MSFGFGVGDIMAISGLAVKVYTACKDAPYDYRDISDEVKSLHIVINKAAQHFENTTLSDSDRQKGQEILAGCQRVLEDLDSIIDQRVMLGTEDIVTLRTRLKSNTTLLNAYIQRFLIFLLLLCRYIMLIFYFSCELLEIQARLNNVLGLHRSHSLVSIDSITSFAGSINIKKAYKKFCKDLFQIGITADMISQKEKEISDLFKAQNTAASSQIDDSPIEDQSQLLGAGSSNTEGGSQIDGSPTECQSQSPGAGCSNRETSLYMSSH